jgi:rRNA pseudouridine-1189 N-methylase Emg1 (Nep1/Mra1 family)
LLRGFGIKEISAVIHTSEKAIVKIKDKYELPREN